MGEYAYLIKYPEWKSAKVQDITWKHWRIRQTAIYHQYKPKSGNSIWILLSPMPSSVAELRIGQLLKEFDDQSTRASFHPPSIDNAMISSYLNNWRPYFEYYETQITPIV